MENQGFALDDDSGTGDQKQTNPQESRLSPIQRCVRVLVHASQCNNCSEVDCHKMKRVILHAKGCKQKTSGGCSICKQLIGLFCYHAKHCQKAGCSAPFCYNVKRKLRQQQLQKRLELKEDMRRRTATWIMNGRQTLPLMDATSYGKDNPVVNPVAVNRGLMAPNQQMQGEMQTPMSQMMSGIPNPMLNMGNVASWANSGFPQNQQPHQNTQHLPNPQLTQHQSSQIMGEPNSVSNSIEDSAMGSPEVMPNPGPSIADMQGPTPPRPQLSPLSADQQQLQQQILAILKADPKLMAAFVKPRTAQQQQQILPIVKADPKLMAALMKHRTAQKQQQQQQQLQ